MAAGERTRWFIGRDNDGHTYLVPVENRDEWNKWRDIPETDERSWTEPDFARRIDAPLLTFTDPSTDAMWWEDTNGAERSPDAFHGVHPPRAEVIQPLGTPPTTDYTEGRETALRIARHVLLDALKELERYDTTSGSATPRNAEAPPSDAAVSAGAQESSSLSSTGRKRK